MQERARLLQILSDEDFVTSHWITSETSGTHSSRHETFTTEIIDLEKLKLEDAFIIIQRYNMKKFRWPAA